jgi:hypothetical protein
LGAKSYIIQNIPIQQQGLLENKTNTAAIGKAAAGIYCCAVESDLPVLRLDEGGHG